MVSSLLDYSFTAAELSRLAPNLLGPSLSHRCHCRWSSGLCNDKISLENFEPDKFAI